MLKKSKKTVSLVVTHEGAKEYLQKLEQQCFIEDDDSDGMAVADGEFFLENNSISHFGYDSDNDDTILRGNNGNGVNSSLTETFNDSPDFYDSDDDDEVVEALKHKYMASQKN